MSEFIWELYRDKQMDPYLILENVHLQKSTRGRGKINYIKINGRVFAEFPESKLIDKNLGVGGEYK